jgi:energy-coupling factor transporter ATPase
MGIIFQNPDNQFVGVTVKDDIAFGLENHNVPRDEMIKKVNRYAELVGMEEFLETNPENLSGGQKQRVAIAGVLAMETEIIIFDEATSMLDPRGTKEIIETIKSLKKNENKTIIMITHNLEEVVFSDRVIVLNDGKIALDGTPREVLSRRQILEESGLAVIDSIQLISEIEQSCLPNKEALVGGLMGINFRDVSFRYNKKSPKPTLDNINLDINEKGEFITILGHTGSGKSTLVQHMNALLLPDFGEVEIFGKHITRKYKDKLKDIRKKVGLVFQFPEYQLFEDSVLKDVMFGPKNFGLSEEEAKVKAIEACRQVGLSEDLWDRSPFTLSGGQMRRVAIAGILASEPDILILDEPTVGLDPVGKKELLNLLEDIRTQTGKTIIIISHDMNVVAKHATRVIVLNDGKVVYNGPKLPLFSDLERLASFNLDLPDSARIALKLKEKGLIAFDDLPLSLEELRKHLDLNPKGDSHE